MLSGPYFKKTKANALVFFALLSALLFVFFSYSTALHGPFLFDDFPNLKKIGQLGGVKDLNSLMIYLASGNAGPTGRPLSLLSFLIDDQAWPSDPYLFKLTNLWLHLLNGLLLMGVLFRLSLAMKRAYLSASLLAILGAFLWMADPYLVSTVMYVVQRMTMLAATFTLGTLWFFMILRDRYHRAPSTQKMVSLSLVVVLGSLFSTFSKENGALTPGFILIIELFILQSYNPIQSLKWKNWVKIFLGLPVLFIILYLCWQGWLLWGKELSSRTFNIQQRLMTESRLIWFYLYNFFLPSASTAGLFNDNVVVSTSLFSPYTTLLSTLGLGVGIFATVYFRHRFKILCAAIAYFLWGHAIESTTIPLELAFEHRNYLPTVLLWFAIICTMSRYISNKKIKIVLLSAVLVLVDLVLIQRASLWGNQNILFLTWAKNAPFSERAQLNAALTWARKGKYIPARRYLNIALRYHPNSVKARIASVYLDCSFQISPSFYNKDFFNQLDSDYKSERYTLTEFNYLKNLSNEYFVNHCEQLSTDTLLRLVDAFMTSPYAQAPVNLSTLLYLKGHIYLLSGQPIPALEYFQKAFRVNLRVGNGLMMVAELATYSHYAMALNLLQQVDDAYKNGKDNIVASRDFTSDIKNLFLEINSSLNDAKKNNLK